MKKCEKLFIVISQLVSITCYSMHIPWLANVLAGTKEHMKNNRQKGLGTRR